MTRVIVSGDRNWNDRILADALVRRLRKRYGRGLTVITGDSAGIDAAVASACHRYGVTQEVNGTGRWNDLKVHFVVACHRNLPWSKSTRSLVQRALDRGLPVYLIAGRTEQPRRIRAVSDAGRTQVKAS